MPIYDYVCSDCKHRVEVIHGINDTGPRFCPSCGHEGTMRKALGTPAIHFKGSGWAKKDRSSTSGTRTKAGSSSSSGSSDGASGGTSGSDSKAAADTGSASGGSSSGSSSPSSSSSTSKD
ncbi:MAG TPA: zinc ribbon domain-containing protein [Candidatus Limnocylindrales bacterium]|nr:zinc ribbon domain-containing protein [Candidatus Limnocylindrales bacterium]